MNKGIMKNTGVGIFFILLALAYLSGTSKIVSFTPFGCRGMDSRSIPQMLGVLMLALAVLQVALTAQKNKREAAAGALKPEERRDICCGAARRGEKWKTGLMVSYTIALLIAYALMYQKLGFVLSTLLYLLSSTIILTPAEKRKKMTAFIVPFTVVFTALIYILFTKYLTLMLPAGILG